MAATEESPKSGARREIAAWLGLPMVAVVAVLLLVGAYVAVGRGIPHWLPAVDAWAEQWAFPGCMSALSAVEVGWTADELRAHLGAELQYHDGRHMKGAVGPTDPLDGQTVAAECRKTTSYSTSGSWASSGDWTRYVYEIDGAGNVVRVDVTTGGFIVN
jgi:hypothetical protein